MRYHFDLEDGTSIKDAEGEELRDDAEAIAVAQTIATELARNNPLAKEWIVFVRDASRRLVTKIQCVPQT